uniref:SWIM-type domain-containing protein n=1 Tax=Tanacetum cinerariifolium TaxID=118510 RepID=A0A699IAC8_TANCI|nr:hypothetical protein [Tanacetum cinerariifolium]
MADGIKTMIKQDVMVQETPKGTPQSGSRIHQTTLGYAPNCSDEVDSPCQTQKGTPQSGSMAHPTTLGLVRSFKVMKEMYSGFGKIGATSVECKNFRRVLNHFIGNRDAHMVIQKLLARTEFSLGFSVEYLQDENDKYLVGLFWAEEVAKQNYAVLGDVVSFDATFCSNRYNMVLVPFTGIDNHNSNTDFKRRLCNIVWSNKIEPKTFVKKWAAIMDEFLLNENKWLSDMFEMRGMWIPAYFRNEPMSGLMRTMSRFESENHFFGQITSTRLSLVEFVSHYNTAMDSQRFIYGKNNHDSMNTMPDLKTDLLVEKEVAELYTTTLFYDVQEEIYSSLMNCYALNVHEGESRRHFMIHDTGADFEYKGVVVEVKYEGKINCSCLRHECYGLLCRHIFYVLRLSKVHNFPKSYLQKRWSKNAMPHKRVGCTVEVESSSNAVTNSDSLIRDITLERGCNIDNVPALRQLALKDEHGFDIHLGSRLH